MFTSNSGMDEYTIAGFITLVGLMIQIIRFFWRLAILQHKPQDLPASPFLMISILLLSLVFSIAAVSQVMRSLEYAVLAVVLDTAVSAILLYWYLQRKAWQARFLQAFTALLGVGLLISLLGISAMQLVPESEKMLKGLLNNLMFFWLHLAIGHVLRHTLEIRLSSGVLISFVYYLLVIALIAPWFDPAALEAMQN